MFWDIALEVFGYVGTVLVVISMLMTDINKLRIINISGGFVSLIYALIRNTMPIVVMNFILITINIFQLIKSRKNAKAGNSGTAEAYIESKKQGE